jgi:hypothetical protein
VGRSSVFSCSASRYSYSKTPESNQVDHLFRKAVRPEFGPFVNEILILFFEYEYEKNQWYELPATIMPVGPIYLFTNRMRIGPVRSRTDIDPLGALKSNRIAQPS